MNINNKVRELSKFEYKQIERELEQLLKSGGNIEESLRCGTLSYSPSYSKLMMSGVFDPLYIAEKENTVGERLQCWLVDDCEFPGKKTNLFKREGGLLLGNDAAMKAKLNELKDHLIWESYAGHCVCAFITSMMFRLIDLISQGIKQNVVYASMFNLSGNQRQFLNLGIAVATFLSLYSTGYGLFDLLLYQFIPMAISSNQSKLFNLGITVATSLILCNRGYELLNLVFIQLTPMVIQSILSHEKLNYIKEINALSSHSKFNIKDFLHKNMLSFAIKSLPAVLLNVFVFLKIGSNNYSVPTIFRLCLTKSADHTVEMLSKSAVGWLSVIGLFVEPMIYVLGKMTMDLIYILGMKLINRNSDLRDPLSFLYASKKVANEVVEMDFEKKISSNKGDNKEKSVNRQEFSTGKLYIGDENVSTFTKKSREAKVKQRGKKTLDIFENLPVRTETKPLKVETLVTIKVMNVDYCFSRVITGIENENAWMVVACESLSDQDKEMYEKKVSKGLISNNGSVRPLENLSGCYEVRTDSDPRLIGKKYKGGFFKAFKCVTTREEALMISQALDEAGLKDEEKISVIIFSRVAEKHGEINKVARNF